jgi:hypothetical protein
MDGDIDLTGSLVPRDRQLLGRVQRESNLCSVICCETAKVISETRLAPHDDGLIRGDEPTASVSLNSPPEREKLGICLSDRKQHRLVRNVLKVQVGIVK